MVTNTVTAQLDQFEAAKTGNLQWFKQQHAAGTLPDLTLTDVNSRNVFECAAESGHLDVVKYLIAKCTQDIDATIFNPALRYAAKNGHLDVVKYLIEDSGQNVDTIVLGNYTICLAANNGHLEVVKYLIEESGQNVDATADDNYAVCLASSNGHLDVVKYLIEDSGQDVDATARNNYAIRYAAENGHLDVVKYLIEDSGQDVDVTSNDMIADSNCALRFAATNGHLNVVKYLIEDCPQYIDLPRIGRELLQEAADQERSELIIYLTPICEATEVINSDVYKKIRPILFNSGTSGNVNTIVDVNNNNLSKNLPSSVSEISEASRNSFTDMLQHLAVVPAEILQTLVTSAEGLQQLRVYLQKTSSDELHPLATKTRVPRL